MDDMLVKFPAFSGIMAVAGAVLGNLLGGYDGFLSALVALTVIDYITGLMRAFSDKSLSSEVGFKGIFKKALIFLLVIVANVVDSEFLGNSGAARTAVIFFYASNEGVSILENAVELGLPVPEKLREALKQLGKGGGGDVK